MPDILPFTPDVIGDFRPAEYYEDDDDFADYRGLCEMDGDWDDEPRYPEGFRVDGRCSRCGCTERRACRDGGHGCAWATCWLCTRCARFPGRRRWRRRRRPPQGVVIVRGRPPMPMSWPTVMRAAREGIGLWELC